MLFLRRRKIRGNKTKKIWFHYQEMYPQFLHISNFPGIDLFVVDKWIRVLVL